LATALKTGYNLRLRTIRKPDAEPLGIVQHGYSHFSVTTHVFRCELASRPDGSNLKWISLKALDAYPMGKIDRQIAKMIVK